MQDAVWCTEWVLSLLGTVVRVLIGEPKLDIHENPDDEEQQDRFRRRETEVEIREPFAVEIENQDVRRVRGPPPVSKSTNANVPKKA